MSFYGYREVAVRRVDGSRQRQNGTKKFEISACGFKLLFIVQNIIAITNSIHKCIETRHYMIIPNTMAFSMK